MKSELFNDLLISAQEMVAIEKGQKTPEKHHTHSSRPNRLHNAGVTGSSPVIATTNSKARDVCKYSRAFSFSAFLIQR
jgi:hypothetical protein